jgi:hydrophobic/amphiphilic exporter-1 (mainly G- bacteria), HAE1 family
MAEFFIRRPIVAIVISILIVLVGLAMLASLPIEMYPSLAPPVIQVQANYPGASAEAVEQSVATPIEQQINGVENLLYMKSLNTSDGRMLLQTTFQVGTDLDTANMLTQNRAAQANARLPQEVTAQGVTVKKVNPSILMVVSLYSPGESRDAQFLNNYAMINVRDAILRVSGVADVQLLGGAEYGMRIWLRPDRLAKLGMTSSDVIQAIREQNIQAPAGKVGAPPSPPGQEFTYTVRAPGKLVTPEEFERIIVRQTAEGAIVRLGDVARAELGSENYLATGRLDGKPAGVLAVYLLPGANQLVSAEGIYEMLGEMKLNFPQDVDYKIVYDTTPAVEASVESIVHTFFEAVVLVILVVFVFLQNWRATLIPLLTVPVSLIGTLIFFPLFGFTINTLTMFGLVLAIGIVVDDAIVVVEAVMHHIEHGLSPREATFKAMKEVSGAVVGIALILSAVFVPVAFIGGLTGRMYQQFALTIAISVVISAFNALSLSPALAAMLLKPTHGEGRGPMAAFFRGFNRGFDKVTGMYVRGAAALVRKSVLSLVAVVVVLVLSGGIAGQLRTGFVPNEDQGIFMINLQLPPGASLERTDAAMRKVEAILAETPGVESYNSIGGMGMITNSFQTNYGSFFCRLEPWEDRESEEKQLRAILGGLRAKLATIPEGIAFPFIPPTIPGFGAAGGFNFVLQDRSGTMTVEELGARTREFMAAASQRPELANLLTSFDPTSPQVKVDLDREKARKLGVPITDVFATLQTALGGAYVNDFNRFGRLYRVFAQAEAEYRQSPADIEKFYVRSATTGEMIPLSTLVTVTPSPGTEVTVRYNLFRSVEISGQAAPGYSSGRRWRRWKRLRGTSFRGRWASNGRGSPTRRRRRLP